MYFKIRFASFYTSYERFLITLLAYNFSMSFFPPCNFEQKYSKRRRSDVHIVYVKQNKSVCGRESRTIFAEQITCKLLQDLANLFE